MEYPVIEEQFRKLLPQGNVLVVAASEATRTSLANLSIRIMEERGARLILVETPENASLAPEHRQHLRLSHELVEDCYYLSNDILRGNKAFDPIVVHPFLGESTLQLIDAIVGRRTGGNVATIEADGVVPAIDKIFHFMQGACLQRKTRTCLSYSVINGAFQFIFFENPVGRELEIYKVHEYASIEQYQAGGDHLERIY